ncbi:MAG: 3-deoxy-D-manno-octulosonic acid transferase [Deltaproteobacteria bacterium]|nr:3-deoxy-D-manno-octulosonic acid transferase [Deltaproteobacteria bacterium]
MKNLLYDILLHISILIAAPYFFFKMLTSHKYRHGLMERFGIYPAGLFDRFRGGRTVWFHAISVGETKAAVPVLRALRQRHPGLHIFFSTVTQTGRRTAEQECQGLIDGLVYFPLDLSWVVASVIRRLKPAVFVTVEKDIWPNTFTRLASAGVPVVIINGTLSDRSARRFERFGFFFKDVFGCVSAFCARTPEDGTKAALVGIAPERIHTTGNIKFDIHPAAIDKKAAGVFAAALGLRQGEPVFTAGSTHAGEEETILRVYAQLLRRVEGLRLVLAPRHPERFNEAEALVKKSGLAYGRRTQGPTDGVVILDTVGELMTVWSFTDVAFVGGSLVPGIGGHNLLEPAFFGRPVVCGTHLSAYLSMAELLEAAGGGGRVADEAALLDTLTQILTDKGRCVRMGAAAKSVVEANRGAAVKTVEIIEGFMPGV